MGAPVPEMNADLNQPEDASAEALLNSLRTISPGERRKHASVYNYWLAIRRDRDFPPIRDLDPLELSEAGPSSLLLEMIGGGEDAEIRHLGQAIRRGIDVAKVGEAPNPSLLSCIATRLPVVAACREAFAFEDDFDSPDGKIRCWVTLLPFSATGTWIDYVYGFVSLKPIGDAEAAAHEPAEPVELAEEVAAPIEEPPAEAETVEQLPEPVEAAEEAPEPVAMGEPQQSTDPEPELEEVPEAPPAKPGFSTKFFEKLATVGGFYGTPMEVELDLETASLEVGEVDDSPAQDEALELEETAEPQPVAQEDAAEPQPVAQEDAADPMPVAAEEPVDAAQVNQPISTSEGTLQSKLTQVRAKADEARQAKLRANTALYEGLSAAYDFALDAEDTPEEYLRLVEAEGLKIQLRSPMKPVAKLAFDGMCDELTIKQLEAVLSWAFEEELPRGALAERIEAAGGIGAILNGQARAA